MPLFVSNIDRQPDENPFKSIKSAFSSVRSALSATSSSTVSAGVHDEYMFSAVMAEEKAPKAAVVKQQASTAKLVKPVVIATPMATSGIAVAAVQPKAVPKPAAPKKPSVTIEHSYMGMTFSMDETPAESAFLTSQIPVVPAAPKPVAIPAAPKAVAERERVSVSSYTYNHLRGAPHGVATAVLVNGILNPLDRMSGIISVTPGLKFGAAFQMVKSDLTLGAWGSIKYSAARNAIIYTVMPDIRRYLREDRGFSPCLSASVAGMGAGAIEAYFMAKPAAIKNRQHLMKEKLAEAEANVTKREKTIAFRWGVPKGGIYWAIFPILTATVEQMLGIAADDVNPEGHNFNPLKSTAQVVVGSATGAVAAFFSYPFDVGQKRHLLKPDVNPMDQVRAHYKQHGLFSTVRHHTHVGYLSMAVPRMAIASGLYNIAFHGTQFGLNLFVKKADAPKPPKAAPTVTAVAMDQARAEKLRLIK